MGGGLNWLLHDSTKKKRLGVQYIGVREKLKQPVTCDILLVDAQGLYLDLSHRSDVASMPTKFRNVFDRIMEDYPPSKEIFVILDGAPPAAKFIFSTRRPTRNERIYEQITPETSMWYAMMADVCRDVACEKGVKCVLDGMHIPGEGECKLMNHFRECYRKHPDWKYVVWTPDGDLMGLLACECEMANKVSITMQGKHCVRVFTVNDLQMLILRELQRHDICPLFNGTKLRRIRDYCALYHMARDDFHIGELFDWENTGGTQEQQPCLGTDDVEDYVPPACAWGGKSKVRHDEEMNREMDGRPRERQPSVDEERSRAVELTVEVLCRAYKAVCSTRKYLVRKDRVSWNWKFLGAMFAKFADREPSSSDGEESTGKIDDSVNQLNYLKWILSYGEGGSYSMGFFYEWSADKSLCWRTLSVVARLFHNQNHATDTFQVERGGRNPLFLCCAMWFGRERTWEKGTPEIITNLQQQLHDEFGVVWGNGDVVRKRDWDAFLEYFETKMWPSLTGEIDWLNDSRWGSPLVFTQ